MSRSCETSSKRILLSLLLMAPKKSLPLPTPLSAEEIKGTRLVSMAAPARDAKRLRYRGERPQEFPIPAIESFTQRIEYRPFCMLKMAKEHPEAKKDIQSARKLWQRGDIVTDGEDKAGAVGRGLDIVVPFWSFEGQTVVPPDFSDAPLGYFLACADKRIVDVSRCLATDAGGALADVEAEDGHLAVLDERSGEVLEIIAFRGDDRLVCCEESYRNFAKRWDNKHK